MIIGIDVRKLNDFGIGTHIRNVVLPAARRAVSHSFYLYCDPGHAEPGETAPNLTWIPESSKKYSPGELFSLARKARQNRIRLYHSPHYTLPVGLPCRSIVTVHDLIHLKFAHLYPSWKVTAAKLVMKKAISRADLILTVSETSKNDLLEFFPSASGKIEIIYNRLSRDWLDPVPELNLRDLGIGKDYLLYVGNLKKHKGIDALLDVYRRLSDPPPLVLVGNSYGAEHSLLEKIFCTPKVRLLGLADQKILRKIYAEAMLFIFPSLYEGFGYPPVEAMLCGAPVLSSDAPALKEVLADGAEFFERGNSDSLMEKMTVLLQNETARKTLAERGRRHAIRFTGEEPIQQLMAVYERFV